MKYISVCSGIEAATVAWHSLGWEPVAFAEIEAFPSAVLAHHFPAVPNLGDISKVNWRPYHGAVDLVVGGTPCQSFSIAGKREGLDGASGLVFEYFRLLREVQPRWFVWENVPGSFSSNKGADFQSILREWDKLGYNVAWRVLDAQFFGVPQRRRRIFAVGHLGDWRYPAQVLFEPDCLRRDSPKGGKARKGSAAHAESGTRIDWPARVGSTLNAHFGEKMGLENQHINQGAPLFVPATVGTLAASGAGASRPAGQGNELDFLIPAVMAIHPHCIGRSEKAGPNGKEWRADGKASTLDTVAPSAVCVPTVMRMRCGCEGSGKGALLSEDRSLTLATGNDQILFEPMACDTYNHTVDSVAPALTCKNDGTHSGPSLIELMPRLAVRRLTPTECERLQGFPDGWTDIPWRGKDHAPDGPRYKALGNSMAVPCMRWIGERINNIENQE